MSLGVSVMLTSYSSHFKASLSNSTTAPGLSELFFDALKTTNLKQGIWEVRHAKRLDPSLRKTDRPFSAIQRSVVTTIELQCYSCLGHVRSTTRWWDATEPIKTMSHPKCICSVLMGLGCLSTTSRSSNRYRLNLACKRESKRTPKSKQKTTSAVKILEAIFRKLFPFTQSDTLFVRHRLVICRSNVNIRIVSLNMIEVTTTEHSP